MIDDQFAAYEARVERGARLKAEILPHNKGVLFDALAGAGIATVTIDFDGYGDSGSFQEAAAFSAENTEIPLPAPDIVVKTVVFETKTVSVSDKVTTARDFLEELTSDFPEETHSGWEDGEGAYGQFRFSLADRTITLEYNERYVDSHLHEHEF
jgi:Family of unknown function (DUF6878)